jgi:hypothetical protein
MWADGAAHVFCADYSDKTGGQRIHNRTGKAASALGRLANSSPDSINMGVRSAGQAAGTGAETKRDG